MTALVCITTSYLNITINTESLHKRPNLLFIPYLYLHHSNFISKLLTICELSCDDCIVTYTINVA